MRFSTRRSAAALLIVVALIAAACGGASDSGSSDGPPKGGEKRPCPSKEFDAAGKPVQITMWHAMNRDNETTLQQLTDAFMAENPDIAVELVNQTSYEDIVRKFRSGITTGDLPDVLQAAEYTTQLLLDSEQTVPVQSCIEADDFPVDDLIPRAIDYYTFDGDVQAVPFNVSNPVLIYDRNDFVAAGLDPEDPPATLSELKETSRQIVESGAAKYGFAIKLDGWYVEQWQSKAGELFVNNDNGRSARATEAVFDNDTGLETYEFFKSMVDEGLAVNTGPAEGNINNLLSLGNGESAMTIDSTATLGTAYGVVESGAVQGVDPLVGPMPGPEQAGGGVQVGGAALWIMRKSSAAEQYAAWKYLEFLIGAESQAIWSAGTGYIPVNQESVDQPVLQEAWQRRPGYRVAYEQLLEGEDDPATAGPLVGPFLEVRKAIESSFVKMLQTNQEPQQALDGAVQAVDALLADYNESIGAG